MRKWWLSVMESRRRRDQERILFIMWSSGLSRLPVDVLRRDAGLSVKRADDALRVLQAARLVSVQERSFTWGLTTEGQRVAGVKAGSAARRAWP